MFEYVLKAQFSGFFLPQRKCIEFCLYGKDLLLFHPHSFAMPLNVDVRNKCETA